MRRLVGLALVVLVGTWLPATPVATADRGVAVDIGRVEVSEKLSRGGTYQLPAIGVRNPGTETTRYRMGVSHVQDQDGRPAPDGWFTFDPAEVTLASGDTVPVSVSLKIPSGATPDDYEALLQAEIAPEGEGTTVGAAAAARLTFTVKPSNILQAWQLEAETWFDDNRPWTILLPLMAALVAAAWWLRRRFTISVGRRA